MNKAERRQSLRVPVKFEINYIHEGDYLISFSGDLSVEGMFIYTENPPPMGRKINLTFSLENTDPIDLEAMVIWANRSKDKRDRGVGVQFLNSSKAVRDAILKYIKRVAIIEKFELNPTS